ncbi:MAG: hypothetical protein K2O45_07375, partial [Oscillospiraceae bacterium]|nr:hypothetical protein [Oscillospiraceae bacterium]
GGGVFFAHKTTNPRPLFLAEMNGSYKKLPFLKKDSHCFSQFDLIESILQEFVPCEKFVWRK